MKSRRNKPARPATEPSLDAAEIDAKYGLEPVIEPAGEGHGDGDAGAVQFTTVQCPYCGEPFETTVDTSAGSSSYIEDCQVCCRPIEIGIDVSAEGMLESVRAQRSD